MTPTYGWYKNELKKFRKVFKAHTQRGWIADFDWQDVGPRFFEPIPDGKYKGFTIAKWLPDMIWDYYKLSGRHERTGRPFRDMLENLGLQEFTPWSQEASHL